MSSLAQDQPSQPKRHCKHCEELGFPGQEVIRLSTYGGRDNNIVNLDGSPHLHLFNKQKWEWNHYENSGEVARWDKTC